MEENHRDLGRVADPGRAVRALDEEFEETVAPTGSVSHREEARLFLRRVLAYFYILSWVFRVNRQQKDCEVCFNYQELCTSDTQDHPKSKCADAHQPPSCSKLLLICSSPQEHSS